MTGLAKIEYFQIILNKISVDLKTDLGFDAFPPLVWLAVNGGKKVN